jgi:hypothetical protein
MVGFASIRVMLGSASTWRAVWKSVGQFSEGCPAALPLAVVENCALRALAVKLRAIAQSPENYVFGEEGSYSLKHFKLDRLTLTVLPSYIHQGEKVLPEIPPNRVFFWPDLPAQFALARGALQGA